MSNQHPMRLTALCLALFAGAASATPVKIALVETLSGPQASSGLLFKAAARYTIDKLNAAGGWNGQPIQLMEYDNQGGPSGAADKVKTAIADGVQFVLQGASSAVSGQVTEDVRKHNLRNPGNEIVFLNVGGEAMELTGEKCHFHHFRFNSNAPIRVKALVGAMKQNNVLGKRVYSINQNYSWGQDMEKAIGDYATVGGYQVVEKVLHDVNKVQDFTPYVAKINAVNADTVLTGNWSNDLLLLMKATKSAGLKTRFGTAFLDQPGNLANAGDVALGHYVAHLFNPEAAGKEGEQFAEDYKAKTGHYPAFIEAQTVFGLLMAGEVLRTQKPAQGGKLNVNGFAKALSTAKYRSTMGETRMRAEDHQLLMPVVVSTVTKDAKYKVDGTDMGFKPVKVFSADEAAIPVQANCKIQVPN